MKKLRKIVLLTSVLIALGMPSFYAATDPSVTDPDDLVKGLSLVQSPPPRNPFASDGSDTGAPAVPVDLQTLGTLVKPEKFSSFPHRSPGTLRQLADRVGPLFDIDVDELPASPIPDHLQTAAAAASIALPPSAVVPAKALSVKSAISTALSQAASLEPTDEDSSPRQRFSLLNCLSCMKDQPRSTTRRASVTASLRNLDLLPADSESAVPAAQHLSVSLLPDETIFPTGPKEGYANVSDKMGPEGELGEDEEEDAQQEGLEEVAPVSSGSAAALSDTSPSATVLLAEISSGEALPTAGASIPHDARNTATSDELVRVQAAPPKKKKGFFKWGKSKEKAAVVKETASMAGEALPAGNTGVTASSEIALSPTDVLPADAASPTTVVAAADAPTTSDEPAVLPADVQSNASGIVLPVAKSKKKKSSSWLACWSRTKNEATAVGLALEAGFVDVAPYLAGGLKFAAASLPNPAIQAVINFLALSIEEGASALSRDGATIHIKKGNGEELTVASPPFLHAQNFVNTSRLSDESIMLITLALDRMNRPSNYKELIGLINIIVAQDSNNSPETLGFNEGTGEILLYPNDSLGQIPLLSLPVMKNLKDTLGDTRSHFGYAITEYIEAAQKRSEAEDILGRLLSGNFLPTDRSWVRVPYQDLVSQGSPFVLKSLDAEKGVDPTVLVEIEDKRRALQVTLHRENPRISFPLKNS